MTFLLRAALVIGVLSYLAAARQGAGPSGSDTAALRSTVEMTTGGLAGLAVTLPASLPPEARTEALRLGGEAMVRRLAGPPASADTLSASDRTPAWRGAGGY